MKNRALSPRLATNVVPPRDGQRRVDRLVELIDRCSEAKAITEEIDAPFLAYLLSMAIQEARTELRSRQT